MKEQRDLFVSRICASLNFSPSDFDNESELFLDYRLLSWVDLQNMDANSLFTIGGHTTYHNIFSTLTVSQQEKEISETISALKSGLGQFSGCFAYPEGQDCHYTPQTVDLLRSAGVTSCPSAMQGVALFNMQSLFDFKRIMVGIDKSSDGFIGSYL